ncbi:hypothetical protein MY8738_009499 [Beauveria namnaoensis]
MAAAQEQVTPKHDEVKFPLVPSKCDAVEVPNIINAPAAKRHCTRAARYDQQGPRNAIILSLDAAMRGECRRRLYVHPIAWTPYHLELLGVHFRLAKKPLRRQGSGDAQVGSHVDDKQRRATNLPRDVKDGLRAIECLVGWGEDLQRIAMATLLQSYGLTRTRNRDRIEMQSRGETVCRLHVQGVWTAKTEGQMMISTNFDAISKTRHKWVHGGKQRASQNYGAGFVVRLKKEKALQPIIAFKDPYICSLLIALAQAHRRSSPEAPGWKVLLLAVGGVGALQLYCYQSWVPAAFLRKLDEPSTAVACPDVVIRISTISLATPQDAARRIWEILHKDELV